MTNQQQLTEDIAFVRAAAERSASLHVPAIYLIWAVLCLCGFTLIDLVGPGFTVDRNLLDDRRARRHGA